jgi:hypothetical protein
MKIVLVQTGPMHFINLWHESDLIESFSISDCHTNQQQSVTLTNICSSRYVSVFGYEKYICYVDLSR